MKKFLVSFCMILALIAMPFLFSACKTQQNKNTDTETEDREYTVSFVTNSEESQIASVKVKDGQIVARPVNPTRTGYVFDGWYTNSSYSMKYNFNGKVRKNLTIYANWYDSDLGFSKTESNNYVVSSCKIDATQVEIPAVYKDRKVVGIVNNAFLNCANLQSVLIPESVTEIGEGAFYGCSALSVINIPSKVTEIKNNTFNGCTSLSAITFVSNYNIVSIGDQAFNGCESLQSVAFPTSLQTIGEKAFSGCTSLVAVNISANISEVGSYAFKNCTGLETVVLPVLNGINRLAFNGCTNVNLITTYCENTAMIEAFVAQLGFTGTLKVFEHVNIEIAGVEVETIAQTSSLFDFSYNTETNTNTLTNYNGTSTDVVVPSYYNGAAVTKISTPAFQGKNITSIVLPSTITEIEDGAFENCANLTKVVFSSNCKLVIPERAFKGCLQLLEITIPSNNEQAASIGASAFEGCANLKKVTLLNGTKISRVEKWAFRNCSELETLELQGNASIGYCADLSFSNCRKFNTIITYSEQIQNTTDAYGIAGIYSAFNRIEFTGDIYVWDFLRSQLNATSSQLKYQDILPTDLFDFEILGDGYTITNCKIVAQNITIPSQYNGRPIIEISHGVFINSTILKNVVLPSTLQHIDDNAFMYCTSLENIAIPQATTTIDENAFAYCYNLSVVEIGSANIYQSFNASALNKLASNATKVIVSKEIVDANSNTYLNNEDLFVKTIIGEESNQIVVFTKK